MENQNLVIYKQLLTNVESQNFDYIRSNLWQLTDSKLIKTLFELSCERGNLEISKYIYETCNINLDEDEYKEVFMLSITRNKLETAKWLHDMEIRNEVELEYMDYFIAACYSGHIDAIEYLYNDNIGRNYINLKHNNFQCLTAACHKGHLNILIWLKNKINIEYYDRFFETACRNGHKDVAEWIYNNCNISDLIDGESDKNIYNTLFQELVYTDGDIDVFKWLYSTGKITSVNFGKLLWICHLRKRMDMAEFIYSINSY